MRGLVIDDDFEQPLALASVAILETGQEGMTTDRGTYLITEVPPGSYTVVFRKPGFEQRLRADVIVNPGQVTELDVRLRGEFTDLEEFVVEDVLGGGAGSEAALIQLRFDSPQLLDSISSELLSRAGASDAAAALNLVSGATVQDGRFAVIRGLPNRFVSSQLNGIRLPTTVDDQRAVELDQFPSTVIESIQVSKTFTPNQQGDATGGAVDVRLKTIPESTIRNLSVSTGFNTNSDWLFDDGDIRGYEGGGVGAFGIGEGNDPQTAGQPWTGAVGTRPEDAPVEYKLSGSFGGKRALNDGWVAGGLLTLFYERNVSQWSGTDDRWERPTPSKPFQPEGIQGETPGGNADDFTTSLFDVEQGTQEVQWGGLAAVGIENDLNELSLTYLYSRSTQSQARLATDTRGKEYYFPGHDPTDPDSPGGEEDDKLSAAPYLRSESIEYTERDVQSLQFAGEHTLDVRETDLGSVVFKQPRVDWLMAFSRATLDQPDRRQFAATWQPFEFFSPGIWTPLAPAANANLGNLNRIFRKTDEDSVQGMVNLEIPFERTGGLEGAVRTGIFADRLDRDSRQDTFSNATTIGISNPGFGFDEPWSIDFPGQSQVGGLGYDIEAALTDIDYKGTIDITSYYTMLEVPVTDPLDLVFGVRYETTDIGIVNDPEEEVFWVPPGPNPNLTSLEDSDPSEYNAATSEQNLLPSLGFDYELNDRWTLRGAFSQTIARQTFQELTPIFAQEFLGGPIFIGNPNLRQSEIDNFDLRLDFEPYDGGLFSVSAFYKDIKNPIEYVQRVVAFSYTTPVNYPKGELTGVEFELRQDLSQFSKDLSGFRVGGNLTILQGQVDFPEVDIAGLANQGLPRTSRDLTEAPEYLVNAFLTYDLERSGTQAALFYTVKGDALVAGSTTDIGAYVPDVYAREYDTLNFTLRQRIADGVNLSFSAKNLTNPVIREVYRDEQLGVDDVTRRSRQNGIDFALGLSFTF
ncbi:MAG: TonB-dependent receptor [Planctomycetota bacterium]